MGQRSLKGVFLYSEGIIDETFIVGHKVFTPYTSTINFHKVGQQYATILYSEVSLNSGPVESRADVPLPLPDRVVHPSARECGGVLSRTSAL